MLYDIDEIQLAKTTLAIQQRGSHSQLVFSGAKQTINVLRRKNCYRKVWTLLEEVMETIFCSRADVTVEDRKTVA